MVDPLAVSLLDFADLLGAVTTIADANPRYGRSLLVSNHGFVVTEHFAGYEIGHVFVRFEAHDLTRAVINDVETVFARDGLVFSWHVPSL